MRPGPAQRLASRASPHERALDAASISDPRLRASYRACRLVNADHGRTYYLASLLLPADRRPHVHALYAFSRTADEFVDDLRAPDPAGLLRWSTMALADLRRGHSDDPVVAATAHTVHRFGLEVSLFEDFLTAMQQDIDTTRYPTYQDLRGYMWGSAAVIGLMMLPLLEPLGPPARDHAVALGEAFQLSNFIRDIGEDLERGRVYLPMEDLDRFGVRVQDLAGPATTPQVRALLSFQVARTRDLYADAEQGVGWVRPQSRPCLRTAIRLYAGILDEVERAGYEVLRTRVHVPRRARAAVALPELARAVTSRRQERRWTTAGQPPG